MKIKTITCHDVYNYGASLQAYALMKYLESKGHDVQIIDYKPDYLCARYSFWYIDSKSKYRKSCDRNKLIHLLFALVKYPSRHKTIARKRPFDKFKDKYLKITNCRYESNEELKIDAPRADLFITGSDQVWNTAMQNGKDPAFYLDFVPKGAVRASYAASFGISDIEKGYELFAQKMLHKLNYISVRETTGLKILESLEVKGGTQVLDPVFLLTREEWSSIIKKEIKEKYLLVYDFLHDPVIEEAAIRIAKEKGWKIYSINDYLPLIYADKNISDAGPVQFMELINSCQLFISNSFHGTVFSIIFEKEFYVFNIKTLNNNSRMIDFLSLLNLSSRHVSSQEQINLIESIDYTKVRKMINANLVNSYSYLDKVLEKK